jgi:hypothetical protein
MKVVDVIKRILIGVVGVIFFVFAIAMTILLLNCNDYGVTKLGTTSLILIREEMSLDKYKKGDLVLVEEKKIDNINVGDEIFTYRLKTKGSVSIEVGTVGEVHPDDDTITFENGDNYTIDFIAGKASKVYSGVGTDLSIIQSKWGFLFIILVPSFLIFIYELYALIVEIKYGKEEAAVQN